MAVQRWNIADFGVKDKKAKPFVTGEWKMGMRVGSCHEPEAVCLRRLERRLGVSPDRRAQTRIGCTPPGREEIPSENAG